MSVIEQAAKRLAELRRAGINASSASEAAPSVFANNPYSADAPAPPISREHDLRKVEPLRPLISEPSDLTTSSQAAPGGSRVELDLAHLAASGVLTPDAPRSQLADEFRVIKRPIIENASRRGPAAIANSNLVIVTSAMPGEGKSFTAANLAMSIAMEMDRTVLLVDADVARPSLPRMLGLPQAQGLLDLLLGNVADVGDVLMKSNVETLSILGSGTPHARATELLASDAMKRLLDEMAQRYPDRLIIFDSPPLLVTTEARVLASHMGQVVVVVQAERTSQADLMNALATIEACPVKMMMLNRARAASTRHAYGYGYSYGYGYGYGSRS